MKIILDKLRPFGVGERPLGERDFYRICERERIGILWSDEKFAFCFSDGDKRFIVLPKRERGLKLLFTALHELAHCIGHAGETPSVLWKGFFDDKNEAEADAMALIALIPASHIGRTDFLDGSRIAKKIWNDRLRLWFLYQI